MARRILDELSDVRRGRPVFSKDGKGLVRMSIAVPEKVRDAATKYGNASMFFRDAAEYFLLTPEYKKGTRTYATRD